MSKRKSLLDAYRFPGFRPRATLKGIFGDPKARGSSGLSGVKKTACGCGGTPPRRCYDRKVRCLRDLSCGAARIDLEVEVRRVQCQRCGKVTREAWAGLADHPFYTKRFAYDVGRKCRTRTVKDVARERKRDWKTVQALDQESMQQQLQRHPVAAPRVIGRDAGSLRKGHTYRIGVSDRERKRPIWYGGRDRSEESLERFSAWLGPKKTTKIRLAVMDLWKAFKKSTQQNAPEAAILFDKFPVMRHLGEALDTVRKMEYARLSGQDRSDIKGQQSTLLSNREPLPLNGRKALRKRLQANKRLHTADLFKEALGQLWSDRTEGGARRFFDNWRDSLKGQRREP